MTTAVFVGHSVTMHDAPRSPMHEPPGHQSPGPDSGFRLLVQGVLDYGIFMLDVTGRVVSWNAGAARIKGYSEQEILGQHFSVFYPPEEVVAGKPARELEVAVADGRLEDEGWRVRKDGTRFWANVVITALFDESGELRGFGKVTRDMTERRRAEQALDERQRLLSHLIEAQEAERRRIAWDVHDDSIQAMVAVGMRLQLLARRSSDDNTPALRQLDDAVHSTISRLRNLIFRLRPPEIDRRGLVNALTGYLDDVMPGWGLAYEIDHALECEPSVGTATTIFRVCQEALTNVRKHARASTVRISLKSVDHGIEVIVADDGVGVRVPVEPRPGDDHFGMIEMRERTETAGGWWSMSAEPGGGTAVRFWLPTPPTRRTSGPSRP